MAAVFTVLLVLAVSVIIVRIASVGLTLTGISKDLAEFQALSAFTRSGFTTDESEQIVNHPVRRRITMYLMLLGHAGMVVAVPAVLMSFLTAGADNSWWNSIWFRLGVLLFGISALWYFATANIFERAMWGVNMWALKRWSRIDVQDYHRLLRFAHDFVVWEMYIDAEDWLVEKTLLQAKLASEGILVLGIERADGTYVGAPRGETLIEVGDALIIYGRQESLEQLDARRAGLDGNLDHMLAVTRQQAVRETEKVRV